MIRNFEYSTEAEHAFYEWLASTQGTYVPAAEIDSDELSDTPEGGDTGDGSQPAYDPTQGHGNPHALKESPGEKFVRWIRGY